MSDSCQQASSARRTAFKLVRLATAASLFLSLECVAARDLETGIKAYSKGQFEKAYPILHHHADLGNARAQMYLCRLYQQGDGQLENADLAYQWCKRAAADGLDEAQFELGVMYLEGVGIEQNDDQALEWIFRASLQGHEQAERLMNEILQGGFSIGC
ncbi:MAG: tetratricopeptide repeat protein [Sedimenticolaceae bacterium]|nr:tetratricopeptide repeat protein [Sedimenticolaceae bacterium]